MSRPPAKASSFLAKLNLGDDQAKADEPASLKLNENPASTPPPATRPKPTTGAAAKKGRPPKRAGGSRQGLKHIGGYVGDETAEQFALLKIRLKLGNDDLLTTAIDRLFRDQKGKRAFGD